MMDCPAISRRNYRENVEPLALKPQAGCCSVHRAAFYWYHEDSFKYLRLIKK
jgi:hypothetical protein